MNLCTVRVVHSARWRTMPDWVTDPRTLIAVAAAIGGIGYWVGQVNSDRKSFKKFMKEVRTDLATLKENFATLRDSVATLRDSVATLKDSVATLRDDVATLRDDVNRILGKLSSPVVESGSPLRLTSLGKRIATDVGASEWAQATAVEVVGDVQDKEPFEIDAFCDRLVRRNLSSEVRRQVARTAFEHGVDPNGVLSVLQVVLRDTLIALAQSSSSSDSEVL